MLFPKAILLQGLLCILGLSAWSQYGLAQEAIILTDEDEATEDIPAIRFKLVEPWTGYSLAANEWKVGLINIDYGITDSVMLGTDSFADVIGVPNLKLKGVVYDSDASTVAVGLRAAYMSKETILWGGMNRYFDRLEGRIVSPSLSWSFEMSERLRLHVHWAAGIGKIHAELNERGKEKLWKTKYPNGNYKTRSKDGDDKPDNDEKRNQQKADDDGSTFKQRTFMFSSLAGLMTDTFQLTGEFERKGGSKVLATTRIEKTRIEDLKANSFRFTVAQQWIWSSFQFKLGVGLQYLVISGVDLDGERVSEAGVAPAADIDFYWRF